jgi:hypothetical protein
MSADSPQWTVANRGPGIRQVAYCSAYPGSYQKVPIPIWLALEIRDKS